MADGDHVLLRFLDGSERVAQVHRGRCVGHTRSLGERAARLTRPSLATGVPGARPLALGKMGNVAGDKVIGLPFGVSLELVGRGADASLRRYTMPTTDVPISECASMRAPHVGRTQPLTDMTAAGSASSAIDAPATANNQNLVDDNKAQALTQEQILELKASAASGEVGPDSTPHHLCAPCTQTLIV